MQLKTETGLKNSQKVKNGINVSTCFIVILTYDTLNRGQQTHLMQLIGAQLCVPNIIINTEPCLTKLQLPKFGAFFSGTLYHQIQCVSI